MAFLHPSIAFHSTLILSVSAYVFLLFPKKGLFCALAFLIACVVLKSFFHCDLYYTSLSALPCWYSLRCDLRILCPYTTSCSGKRHIHSHASTHCRAFFIKWDIIEDYILIPSSTKRPEDKIYDMLELILVDGAKFETLIPRKASHSSAPQYNRSTWSGRECGLKLKVNEGWNMWKRWKRKENQSLVSTH